MFFLKFKQSDSPGARIKSMKLLQLLDFVREPNPDGDLIKLIFKPN